MAKFDNAIPYIKKAEGGLSRAITDSASKNPAPFTYNGKTGWHTNKGITYETFKYMASKVGYAANADNFFKMPDSIWLGIYKKGYWDEVKGDLYNSQALANAIVDYAWAFGVGGARTRISKYLLDKYKVSTKNFTEIANAFNTLTKESDKQVFNDFIEHRKNAFKALKQPANEKGWINRMDTLSRDSLKLLYDNASETVAKVTDEVKKNPC